MRAAGRLVVCGDQGLVALRALVVARTVKRENLPALRAPVLSLGFFGDRAIIGTDGSRKGERSERHRRSEGSHAGSTK
jgi:hypothetical protein